MKQKNTQQEDPLVKAGIVLTDMPAEKLVEIWEQEGKQRFEKHMEDLEASRRITPEMLNEIVG